jgi:hypothetical protein
MTREANKSTVAAQVRIVVVMEGGCVTDVYTSDPNATYEIVDWDDMRDQADDDTDLDEIVERRLEGLYVAS